MIFNCDDITKNYEGKPVIKNISLELAQGGFVSLLGPSGVGKTTLFNILAGVEKPDAGRVSLSGEDITGTSGKVSYMLQKDLLLEHRTVIDNVILPLLIRGEKKTAARKIAAQFFPMFGLAGYEKKYPYQLSGGMRQRAALLRTCLIHLTANSKSDQVILLDEPFSALDAITRRTMQKWYAEIAEKIKVSTFFITHDVEEALILSDTVYIMTGTPGQITEKIDVNPDNQAEQKSVILKAIGL